MAVVATVSVPVYSCGSALTKPHASASYCPGGRLCATTVSFVSLPSLESTSELVVSLSSAPFGPFTVRISSAVSSVGVCGVHAIRNVNSASILS